MQRPSIHTCYRHNFVYRWLEAVALSANVQTRLPLQFWSKLLFSQKLGFATLLRDNIRGTCEHVFSQKKIFFQQSCQYSHQVVAAAELRRLHPARQLGIKDVQRYGGNKCFWEGLWIFGSYLGAGFKIKSNYKNLTSNFAPAIGHYWIFFWTFN